MMVLLPFDKLEFLTFKSIINKMKSILLSLFVLFFLSCGNTHQNKVHDSDHIAEDNSILTSFDSIPKSKVMVLGTYHFRQEKHFDELSDENQQQIKRLVDQLAVFKPTKVVIEIQPKFDSIYQNAYQKYLLDNKFIDTLENEAFQLGFRLAKKMGHEKIYLFDNKTEHIGSLEGFTWEKLREDIAKDSAYVNRHIDVITESFNENQEKYKGLSLYNSILERNSPEAQKWNAQRMHAYEVRTGIKKTWMGPDWVGRWYQRNIRMMATMMSFENPGKDRIVVIVGDNHKWVLDTLLGFNPDFEVVSSYDMLKPN